MGSRLAICLTSSHCFDLPFGFDQIGQIKNVGLRQCYMDFILNGGSLRYFCRRAELDFGLFIQSDGSLDSRVCFDVLLYCKFVLFKV